MSTPSPHFMLFSESRRGPHSSQWRFVLQSADGVKTLEAFDAEMQCSGDRLELLAVIRGLEALDQPSAVTLITTSEYVRRGLTQGLEEWKSSGWTWERFGELVPVKNRDLWQRLDRVLQFHQVECGHRPGPRGRSDVGHAVPGHHFKRTGAVEIPAGEPIRDAATLTSTAAGTARLATGVRTKPRKVKRSEVAAPEGSETARHALWKAPLRLAARLLGAGRRHAAT